MERGVVVCRVNRLDTDRGDGDDFGSSPIQCRCVGRIASVKSQKFGVGGNMKTREETRGVERGCVAVLDDGNDPGVGDRAALQGRWSLISSERDGEHLDDVKGTLTIKGDQVIVRLEDVETRYLARLEPSSVPKALDLTLDAGELKGTVLKGIYALRGEQLTLCLGLTPETVRPVEFATGAESGQHLTVWRHLLPNPNP